MPSIERLERPIYNACMNPKIDLSAVILCYKAGEYAPVFVEKMKKALVAENLTYELVLVANYHDQKSDKTPDIVRRMAAEDPSIVAVARKKEGMMGWDMRSGLDAASGRVVGLIDGDGQMPPEDIVKVYKKLKEGNYDMAKTYRDERYDGFFRIALSRIYNALLRLLFPAVKVKDANSKPKIFTYDALKKLKLASDDWFIDAEIVIQASLLKFRIGEVPTVFYENELRESFVKFPAIFQFIKNLLVYRFKIWFAQWH